MKYEYLLDGLNEDEIKIVSKHLLQIDYNGNNESVLQCLGPVIVNVLLRIIRDDIYFIKENKDILLNLFSVKKITDDLIDFYVNHFSNYSYFKYLDIQAEFTLLFCTNYIHELLSKIKNGNKDLIRRKLKLEKLNYEKI